MLTEPEAPPFNLVLTLKQTISADHILLMVAVSFPTLATILQLLYTADPILQRVDVSDNQTDCSQLVVPPCPDQLRASSPRPCPDNETLVEPVEAELLAPMTLNHLESVDKTAVRLPILPPQLAANEILLLSLPPP